MKKHDADYIQYMRLLKSQVHEDPDDLDLPEDLDDYDAEDYENLIHLKGDYED
jgi:hypothetical protein